MGSGYHVHVWRPLHEFAPEERRFLRQLWDEAFGRLGPDPEFWEVEAARRAFAEAHAVPWRRWTGFCGRWLKAEPHFSAYGPVDGSVCPPFPRWFSELHEIRPASTVPALLHVVFHRPRCIQEGARTLYLPLAQARRRFKDDVGVLLHLFGWVPLEQLESQFPRGSSGWQALRALFHLFDPVHYIRTAQFLAQDLGNDSLLELYFEMEEPEDFNARNEGYHRMIEMVRDLRLDDLYGLITTSELRYVRDSLGRRPSPHDVVAWLNLAGFGRAAGLPEYLIDDDGFRAYEYMLD